MNDNKYKIAQEVFEEYVNSDKDPSDFDDFLKEKTKPKDPLSDKLRMFDKVQGDFIYRLSMLKEIFGTELNRTLGLDSLFNRYSTDFNTTSESVRDSIDNIKAKLEL